MRARRGRNASGKRLFSARGSRRGTQTMVVPYLGTAATGDACLPLQHRNSFARTIEIADEPIIRIRERDGSGCPAAGLTDAFG